MNEMKPEGPLNGFLAAFKFYDSKRRRLSIFARVFDAGEGIDKLEITVLTLSDTPEIREHYETRGKKKVLKSVELLRDNFSRKKGRETYEESLKPDAKKKGRVEIVDIIDNRPRFTFLTWCNQRFYRPVEEEKMVRTVKFVRGKNYVHKKKEKKSESTSEEASAGGSNT